MTKNKRFTFNKTYARPFKIKTVTPNGIVLFTRGKRATWKRKDVKAISKCLPPLHEFNREIFQEIRNKFHTQFDDGVTGRIIYNIYYCNLLEKLGIEL